MFLTNLRFRQHFSEDLLVLGFKMIKMELLKPLNKVNFCWLMLGVQVVEEGF